MRTGAPAEEMGVVRNVRSSAIRHPRLRAQAAAGRAVAELFEAIRRDDPAGTNDQFGSLVAAFQYAKLYDLTSRYVPAGSEVLDWGCGRGHFSYFLIKHGFRVTAYSLEHPPEIFAALSPGERERLTFVRGAGDGASALPFPSGRFAAVFSVGVLEHVRETGGQEAASLEEIRRVLARDGVFVCYHLPNRYSDIEAVSRLLRRSKNGGAQDGFHRYRFTLGDIRSLCRTARLSLSEVERYGFLPRNSFNRLPRRWRESPRLASFANAADSVLERLFSPLDQNYYFVARPAADPDPG